MKITLRVVLGMMTVAGFFMATGSASAVSSGMQLPLMQLVGQAVQSLPEQDRNWIATQMATRHIELMEQQEGLQALTSEERDQLATAMVSQKLPLLREINGGKGSSAGSPTRLMDKMRDQVMNDITDDIASHNQSLCRPLVQPHVAQGMINQIRPWEFPGRVQVNTIPMFTPKIIEQVRAHFMRNRMTNLPRS